MKLLTYCNRTMLEAQHIGLCLDEALFRRELKRLKVPQENWPSFTHNGHAATHFFVNGDGGRTALVCMGKRKGRTLEQIHALLVHEATHIWQDEMKFINEKAAGEEIEAYGIQNIAQVLMVAYRDMKK